MLTLRKSKELSERRDAVYCVLSVVRVAEVEGGRLLDEMAAPAGMLKRRCAERTRGRKGSARSDGMCIFAVLFGRRGLVESWCVSSFWMRSLFKSGDSPDNSGAWLGRS